MRGNPSVWVMIFIWMSFAAEQDRRIHSYPELIILHQYIRNIHVSGDDMIERSHLEILRALGEEGTLTAVPRRLCLTQPAVTHQIQKLEGRAGTALWERDGR